MFSLFAWRVARKVPLVLLSLLASIFIPANYLGATISQTTPVFQQESTKCECELRQSTDRSMRLQGWTVDHIYCYIKGTTVGIGSWVLRQTSKVASFSEESEASLAVRRLCYRLNQLDVDSKL